MQVVAKAGKEEIAIVYIANTSSGKKLEFVESIQPPMSRNDKWVLIISTLYGCPVTCKFCEAGGYYEGKVSFEDMMAQIDYLVRSRFPVGVIPVKKLKIQFARMGEPSFNQDVIRVLDTLPERYQVPGLVVSLSTVAPAGRMAFFEALQRVKQALYPGRFQFQFSIHTTDDTLRRWLIPIETWSFSRMAEYGRQFREAGDLKVTLNFALAQGMPLNPKILSRYFNPDDFLIKITPVNPTSQASVHHIENAVLSADKTEIVHALRDEGYEVILSIGELEENNIGSNCGQYITNYNRDCPARSDSYTYRIVTI